MFRWVINDVTSAAGSAVAKYAVRASVALPFLVGAAFLTAGLTLWLTDTYSALHACLIVGGGYVVLGLLAAMFVQNKEVADTAVQEHAAEAEREAAVSSVATAAAEQMPIALIGSLLSSQGAPDLLAGLAKGVGRNAPAVMLLAALGYLLWSEQSSESAATGVTGATAKPARGKTGNGLYPQPPHVGP